MTMSLEKLDIWQECFSNHLSTLLVCLFDITHTDSDEKSTDKSEMSRAQSFRYHPIYSLEDKNHSSLQH